MMQEAHTRLVDLSTREEAWQLARERELSQATYRIEMGAAIEVGEKRGEKRGERNALAAAVLRVLHARAIPVTDETRTAILSCDDRHRLEGWVERAVSVPRAEDLLAEAD